MDKLEPPQAFSFNKDKRDVAKKTAEVAQRKEQQLAHGEFYP